MGHTALPLLVAVLSYCVWESSEVRAKNKLNQMENCALYVLSLFNVDRKIAYMLRFLKTFSFISPHVYSGSPCLYCWHPPSSFRAGLICKCILQRRHTSRRVVAHTQTLRRWEALKWTQCRDIKKTHGPHLKFIAFKGYHIHFCLVWRLALCVMSGPVSEMIHGGTGPWGLCKE